MRIMTMNVLKRKKRRRVVGLRLVGLMLVGCGVRSTYLAQVLGTCAPYHDR